MNWRRKIVILMPLIATVAPLLATSQTDDLAIKKFQDAVTSYTALRESLGKPSSRPTDAASQITGQRHQLADKVRQARASAKEGDIFTAPVAELFQRKLQEVFSGPEGSRIRESLKHAEPVRGVSLTVNQAYPQSLPLQSTPPSLLLNLPPISKGLQYRIVGRDLVLLDTTTNLVVDVLRNALPHQETH